MRWQVSRSSQSTQRTWTNTSHALSTADTASRVRSSARGEGVELVRHSLAVHGRPHWFQLVLTVIELVLPLLWFWLAPADERAAATADGPRTGAGAAVRPPAEA